MELNLNSSMKNIISIFLLIILPLLVIGLGLFFDIRNAWYFILTVTWFGMGIIFYSAIKL